ncbi:MAG TPA: MFS transporter [Anaerolineales bacterium]|jgi:MFS family permease|nr:MFS transporter [Anaerolineales bacterium]
MDQNKLRRLPRNVWVMSATSLLNDISSEMLLNLVPFFLANILGVRTAVIGLIEGVAETTASLLKILFGAMSDRLRKRKPFAVVGYALSALTKPFLYFASTWGWVLGVRLADRIGKGVRTAPRDALIADSIDEAQRGLAFGLHRASDTLGAFLGLGIAAFIIWLTQAQSSLLSLDTFRLIVLISIIPGILGVLVLALGAADIAGTSKSVEMKRLSFKDMDSRFKYFLFVLVLFTLGNSSDAFILLRGQERGLSILQVMGMSLTFNAVYTVFAGPLGAWSDKVGRRRLMLIGWLAYGLVYLGFAFSQSGWQVWALYALYGLYYAAAEGAAKALVADLVPTQQRGTAYGLFNAAIGLTVLPASLIAGLLWQGIGAWTGFGASAPFFFGALMALLAGTLFSRLVN